jgi:hypothetical protein
VDIEDGGLRLVALLLDARERRLERNDLIVEPVDGFGRGAHRSGGRSSS